MKMHRRLIRAAALAILSVSPAVSQERVTFPSTDGTMLTAFLFRPAGAGPHPAVAAMHGCAGLADPVRPFSAFHLDWAKRLQSAGFVVVFPDSFGSRGLGAICNTPTRAITATGRAADAYGALAFLAAREDVAASRIGLMGWSHGGSTVLFTARGQGRAALDFRAIVAFYPGCAAIRKSGWAPRAPLTILHGEADDWTPIEPCRELAAGIGAALVAYPGAHHVFDAPNLPPRQREGRTAYSKNGDGIVHIGTDEPARQDSIRRVLAIFGGM